MTPKCTLPVSAEHLSPVAAFAAHHDTFSAQEAQAKQDYAQAVLARLKAQEAKEL